ncbi:DICT sensory domain-containing protein [Halopenitus persicus]|uniref:Diguanylate Cyclase and Two-component system sensory domain-containing protein n=1 Tax=Halopenitus persicus TaxID=1048396 RepID=A0A1H3HKS8_9EURY|nr:DICT sensory domain-containing protein [Halopenitus persicus]SDY15249.1 Diguanylate Cyclase and Two-component system sensory domain-containing protein [Halopenitus persicus]
MSLIELIARVEATAATLTVVNANAAARDELAETFADRNLVVTEATLPGAPDRFAVLARDDEFVTAVAVDDLLSPAGTAPEDTPSEETTSEKTSPKFDRRSYAPVLDALDETTFTSYSKRKMVAASREIEDRAWRIGSGELHAGFQTLATLGETVETYNRLAEREDLAVHGYAAPEGPVPDADFDVHVERAPEIRETWFVAYDGGGLEENACLLLAEEREPDRFFGFWTYDPGTVAEAITHVSETYGVTAPGGADG